jgi:hypothetical protein
MEADREAVPMSDSRIRTSDANRPAPPRSMREACARALLDRGGERCPGCPVRDLCQSELRWFVRVPPPH